MQKFYNKLSRVFAKAKKASESGATAIEYGLIAALISVAIIGAVSSVGKNTSNAFNKVAAQMGKTTTASTPTTP